MGKLANNQVASLDSIPASAQPAAPNALSGRNHRGILATLSLIPEIEDPYKYENRNKWIITTIVAVAASAAPIGSSIFYPILPGISSDFRVSDTVVSLSVALYMLSMAIFPLWWSAFSETFGRRAVYLSSFLLSIVFALISGFSTSIGMLVALRVLSGGAAASVQAVGAGTISDIWKSTDRGRAMGIFYLGPLVGPLIVPIIGGALANKFGWRSNMWFLTAISGVVFILILFGLPETLVRDDNCQYQNSDSQAGSGTECSAGGSPKGQGRPFMSWVRFYLLNPLKVVLYLRFPAVVVAVYYAAISFGALYALNISMQEAFSDSPYNFSSLILGVIYLPCGLGYVVASVLGGPWIDRIMIRAASKAGRYDDDGNIISLPEDRMRENAWISASVYPAALIWYGWTIQYGIHWTVPCVASFFFGAGSMLVFSATTTMLTEFMPRQSSSGVALNNLVRNIFSCVASVIGPPIISAVGHGWFMTIVALVAWVTGNLSIWLLRRNSQKWRVHMDDVLARAP